MSGSAKRNRVERTALRHRLIYCDTNTLLNNIKRHQEPKTRQELLALQQLLALRVAGSIKMVRSRVALRELEKPSDPDLMAKLRADYEMLDQIALDEKVLGFNNQWDRFGGITHPLISDVQDDALREELVQYGFDRPDAEHLTQAASNNCDVFLTRDGGIVRHKEWLLARLSLRILRPSELLSALTWGADRGHRRPTSKG